MSIEKIVGNIDTIHGLFKEYGFENVRLFKGFGARDEKTFYLIACLQTKGKDWFVDASKKREIETKLRELLGFYVGITYEADMEKAYLEHINRPGGSVNLSEIVEKAKLKEKLEDYFGKGWQFNILDSNADRKPKPPTSEMLAFPKMVERGTHPVFRTDKQEPLNENVKKIEEDMKELNSKLSELKVDELKILREKLVQSLQSVEQRLLESQAVQQKLT